MATRKTSAKAAATQPKRPVGRPRKAVAATVTVTKTPVKKAAKAAAARAKAVAAPKVEAVQVETAKAETAAAQPNTAATVVGVGAFANLGKDNLSAVIASGNALAKGLEGLNQQILSFAGAAVHHNIEATSALLGAKSLQDVVELQRDYALRSFDRAVNDSAKLTEMGTRVAQDAFAPLQSRVAVAIKTVTPRKAA